jgi:hypothetical protein
MCEKCEAGEMPVKLRRQWVHRDRATGVIVVCTERDLKPSAT